MQNRYVGDVADFGKHGLLRRLCGLTDPDTPEPDLSLGIVWYLTPDERHGSDKKKVNKDGKHITYLQPVGTNLTDYRDCDPDLWEKLRDLVCRGARCVHCVRRAEILPGDTQYFEPMLHFPSYVPAQMRAQMRELWLTAALRATRDADIVLLDPDNGLAPDAGKYQAKGPKYTYADDLRAFWDRGQSLVIYHHLGMDRPTDVLVREGADFIDGVLGVYPFSLRYQSGSPRVFYVIPQECHRVEIRRRLQDMLGGCWGGDRLFRLVPQMPDVPNV